MKIMIELREGKVEAVYADGKADVEVCDFDIVGDEKALDEVERRFNDLKKELKPVW